MSDDIGERTAREEVADYGRQLVEEDLTRGTGGNVSSRTGDVVAINPSGVPYDDVGPEDVAVVDLEGVHVAGELDPSSETPMHTAIYRARDDIGGVVHAHSPFATSFAMTGNAIPPSNYLVAYLGEEIPVAGWEQPGSETLGETVVESLGEHNDACLLQNHGLVSVGSDLEEAFDNALIAELCAQTHYIAEDIGDPIVLSESDTAKMASQFEQYKNRET